MINLVSPFCDMKKTDIGEKKGNTVGKLFKKNNLKQTKKCCKASIRQPYIQNRKKKLMQRKGSTFCGSSSILDVVLILNTTYYSTKLSGILNVQNIVRVFTT